jgi:hypothetical protein
VRATPQGQNTLYKLEVSLFADSPAAQTLQADSGGKQFFYVTDEKGRRFPIIRSSSAAVDISVKPGESAKFSLAFIAPANAGSLYLTGDAGAPPWVRLYFGSDLNPFHRRTLLRVV